MHSPPKLTRVIHLASTQFLSKASEYREQNVDAEFKYDSVGEVQSQFSLPALAGEVADAQKQQVNELKNRQTLFEELQKEYAKLQQKINSVKDKLSAITRKVVLAEEESSQHKFQCQFKEKGLEELIDIETELKTRIENEQRQMKENKNEYATYIDKMDSHHALVAEYELLSDTGIEISSMELTIDNLSQQVLQLKEGRNQSELGINEEYEILQTEIAHLQETNLVKEKNIEQHRSQIKKEGDLQAQLQKDMHLLQKRNHAQLTRLQRQLQEALGRSRHWNEEACKLETNIAQLREKIEE